MHTKRKIFCILLLCTIVCSVDAQSKTEKISALLLAYNKLNAFNGTALISHQGAVIFNEGFGFKNIANLERNDAHTIYQIGSITKQFTAAIILKLEEKHQLQLTDKLSKYFPDFPNGNQINIFNLLTHSSGIYNYTNDANFMNTAAVKPATRQQIISLFKDKALEFAPGTNYAYSNSGYMLLGYIIEEVTKKNYYDVVTDMIFKPLKMTHSGFDFAQLQDENKATGYFLINDKTGTASGLVDSSVSYAAGAIYTTAADMLLWHNALIQNKIITRNSLEKAFTPYKNKYGFGWHIDTIYNKRIVMHGGGIFGFNTNFARIEADNTCIILLNNVGNPKLEEITNSILAILNDQPYTLPEGKTEITLPEEVLKKYIGTYEIVPQFQIVITVENGKLIAQATGQQPFELFAQKENYFFLKAVEAEVEFIKDANGNIEKLILYQGGRQTPGKKLN